jgi:conjugative relaxase-like TrwC/TraI family protein
MMTAHSIGAAKGGGYARYLESKTVEPERGDYYLTPTGEPVQAPGRWLASDETLEMLGIRTERQVLGGDFIALMDGRHPVTGEWLRRVGAGGGRAAGIDVTFSAPKSVSVAWALAEPRQRELIEQAHANAVEQALEYLRSEVPVVRRRVEGVVVHERARDLIAAEYRHTTARGATGAQTPDPQLHSHVVITAVLREDGQVAAVASRPIFRAAREAGAFYRAALAWELQEQGYAIEQATGRHGRYFELAGIPDALLEAFSQRSREVARAAERFRARYGRAPERDELRHLKLENRRAKELATRADLQRAWNETAHAHDFGRRETSELLSAPPTTPRQRPLANRVEERLTERAATFEPREFRATVLEQAAGELAPEGARGVGREMIRERVVLPLEGGLMTTLAVRAKEQSIERTVETLARPADRDVGEYARAHAGLAIRERLGAPLTSEQLAALYVLTGAEQFAVLIGQAGTGKGVVIDAAARAEQHAGRDTLGVAIAGATAERLGLDAPALAGQTLTLDALIARAEHGTLKLDANTTVFYDEAGMSDTDRLQRFTTLIEHTRAKGVLIGDAAQLPSIGAGGMFARLTGLAPTAELETIHRTQDPAEQKALAALRRGDSEYALAHYASRGQLHLNDTRDQAAEATVRFWAAFLRRHDPSELIILSDASNLEVDRLNARAQHLRGRLGQLGDLELQHPELPYGLRENDRVIFTSQHRPAGQPRVENGALGHVTHLADDGTLTVTLEGSERRIDLADDDLTRVRLGYAQHISKQQGATVTHTFALTGGWQTSRETSYVEATRSREDCHWFIAREDLGIEGHDEARIAELATRMRLSRSQVASLTYDEYAEPDLETARELEHVRLLPRLLARIAHPDHTDDLDREIPR